MFEIRTGSDDRDPGMSHRSLDLASESRSVDRSTSPETKNLESSGSSRLRLFLPPLSIDEVRYLRILQELKDFVLSRKKTYVDLVPEAASL